MDWSSIQSAEELERSRSVRFRPEWRVALMDYFGLAPGMDALEVCCGPGTLAPYLAGGVAPGRVTGLDLDPAFIARAREKAPANVDYVTGDAYALPFADDSFDAVLSYTGIGILADPQRAVAEMIRVCRPGGWVSVAEAVTGPAGIRFDGVDALGADSELWPGALRYHALRVGLRPAAAPALSDRRWPAAALWGLLGRSGLKELRLNAWGYCEAPDDTRNAPQVRRRMRERALAEELAWLDAAAPGPDGLTSAEIDELRRLSRARFRWLDEHAAYDWIGGLSAVAAGRKSSRVNRPGPAPTSSTASPTRGGGGGAGGS